MMRSVRAAGSVAIFGLGLLGCGSADWIITPPDQPPPDAATQVAFENQPPATVTSGQPLGNVRITIRNAVGQVATGANNQVSITLSSADGLATLAGTTTVAATAGVANFSDLSVARAGTDFKLIAQGAGLVPATSQAFTIARGPASELRVDPLGTVGVGTEVPAVIRVTDAAGNTVPDASNAITVAYTRTGPFGMTLAPDDTFGPVTATAVNGVAAVHGLIFHKSGSYTLSASSTGLVGGTSSNLSILGVSMTRLMFVTQPQNGTAGVALPTFSVQQVDDYGNGLGLPPGPIYSVTLSLGSNPTGAALGGALTAQAAGATAVSFGPITIDKPGTYTLAATSGTRTVTSAPFNIK